MKITDLFIYLIVGGIFCGFVDRESVKQCNEHIDDAAVVIIVILWPAVIPMALITKETTTPVCSEK
jgi:hypothetical protein